MSCWCCCCCHCFHKYIGASQTKQKEKPNITITIRYYENEHWIKNHSYLQPLHKYWLFLSHHHFISIYGWFWVQYTKSSIAHTLQRAEQKLPHNDHHTLSIGITCWKHPFPLSRDWSNTIWQKNHHFLCRIVVVTISHFTVGWKWQKAACMHVRSKPLEPHVWVDSFAFNQQTIMYLANSTEQ